MPSQPLAAVPRVTRDPGIDVLRGAALVRVVAYHTLGWAWLTIVFPAMGLMFALAGSLMARSLDQRGTSVIKGRLRRLLPPMWVFGIVAVVVMFFLGWRERPASFLGWAEMVWWIVPVRTPPAGGPEWAWAFTAMLWYLVAYLWFVVLSPPLLVVFRRWPWPTLIVSLLIPVALHFDIITLTGYLVEPMVNVATYLCCWLLGFAHHEGLLRQMPGWIFGPLVSALALASAWWLFSFGAAQNDFDVNHVPLANSLWSAAFVAAALRFTLPVGGVTRRPWLAKLVSFINSRAVTIYLWHFTMLIAAERLLGYNSRPETALGLATVLGTVVLLTTAMTFVVGWVEDLAARRRCQFLPIRLWSAR